MPTFQRARKNVDTLTLILLNCAFPKARETELRKFEATIAEGYREGAGLSPKAAREMAKQWIGIVRERVAVAETHGPLRMSNERANG